MAAALRARKKGYDVTIIDKAQRLGGKAQVYSYGGFRYDAGPTVITAPHLFDELFSLLIKKKTTSPLRSWICGIVPFR